MPDPQVAAPPEAPWYAPGRDLLYELLHQGKEALTGLFTPAPETQATSDQLRQLIAQQYPQVGNPYIDAWASGPQRLAGNLAVDQVVDATAGAGAGTPGCATPRRPARPVRHPLGGLMRALLWRVIYAVIAVVLLFALIPMLAALFGFPLGAAWPIIRICVAGIALFYIFAGPEPRTPF